MSKPVTVDDFGAALSEFIARTAHRFATNPAQPGFPDADEMAAYERVKATLAALLPDASDTATRRSQSRALSAGASPRNRRTK